MWSYTSWYWFGDVIFRPNFVFDDLIIPMSLSVCENAKDCFFNSASNLSSSSNQSPLNEHTGVTATSPGDVFSPSCMMIIFSWADLA